MACVLVIDDDAGVRYTLRRMLEQDGHAVVEAVDGNDGLRRYGEQPVDVVITDIVMPEKEGLDVIRDLREHFPSVKIIAISGGGRDGPTDYLDWACLLGAQYALPKPINRHELLAVVQALTSAPLRN